MTQGQRTPFTGMDRYVDPLDPYIQRLQNLEPFNVYTITANGDPVPWYDVAGSDIVRDLVIREGDLATQLQVVSAQIAHWTRHAALCHRVHQIEERRLRMWKAKQTLAIIEAAADGKKPSEKVIEATYRTHPEYEAVNQRVERAEEAFLAADGIAQAFKAKKEMLGRSVTPAKDGIGPRFSVP